MIIQEIYDALIKAGASEQPRIFFTLKLRR